MKKEGVGLVRCIVRVMRNLVRAEVKKNGGSSRKGEGKEGIRVW